MDQNSPQIEVEAPVVPRGGRFRRYAATVLGSLVCYLLVTVSINLYVDPWEMFGPLRFPLGDINLERISLAHNIRLAEKFDVLLLGSSRVRHILSDGDNRIEDQRVTAPLFDDARVFNAALAGSNMHQMRRIFEHALHYHPVKELVFLVDDVMFNTYRSVGAGWQESNYYGSLNYQTPLERVLSLTDFWMLELSLRILTAEESAPASEGQSFGDPALWEAWIREFNRRDLYGCYEIGKRPRQEFDRILTLAKEHGVRVTLISSLVHPTLFEYFYRSDDGSGLKTFLSALREGAKRHRVPAWYFSPFSPVTHGTPHWYFGEKNPNGDPTFDDPGHSNSAMGRRILDIALKGAKSTRLRGLRVDELPLDEVVDRILEDRKAWLMDSEVPFDDFLKSAPLSARLSCSPS